MRRNVGLNCSCCNPTLCRNGVDYCDRVDAFTGKAFCESISKVQPINMDQLNESIAWVNLIGEVASSARPFLAGTRKSLTESLFDEDSKSDAEHRTCRYGETRYHPARIAELIEMGLCIRPVKLSHRVHRIEKPLPRKMSEEEAARFVRACERLETMLDGTYFDVPPFCEEIAPTDATRENQQPIWSKA